MSVISCLGLAVLELFVDSIRMTVAGSLSRARYRPILRLGEGRWVSAQLAIDLEPSGSDKLVVLRTLREQAAADPGLLKLFLAGGRVSARLKHPNVVLVREVLEDPVPCIVTEYQDGQTMATIRKHAGKGFTSPLQLRVISEMLAGLNHAHELRDYDGTPLHLVHRNLGARTVLVTYQGVVKVTDFGMADLADGMPQPATGVVQRKVASMPPEELLGDALDRRADIYAAGRMLWLAATGAELWANTSDGEIRRCLLDGALPRPSSQGPVDAELERIINRALAPDPADRHATALELKADLEQYLQRIAPSCTAREVGRYVSDLFHDEHEKMTRTIQVSTTSAGSLAPPTAAGGMSSSSTGSRARAAGILQHGKVLLAISTTLLLGAGVVMHAVADQQAAGASGPAGPGSNPVSHQRWVTLHLSVTPLDARMTLDGKTIAGNPAVLRVPEDGLLHELRASGAGHEPSTRMLRYDRDLFLGLTLRRAASEEVMAPAREASSPPPGQEQRGAPPACRKAQQTRDPSLPADSSGRGR